VDPFNGKLTGNRQNIFIFYTILSSFQKKTEIDEVSENRELLWSHSQKIIPVNTADVEHLKSKEFPSEKNSNKVVGVEAIASVKLNSQKALDNVLPILQSFQSLAFK
jgi:hypothetical protein